MAYATINPYTGETLKTFPDATDAEVEQAIAAAHEALETHTESPFGQGLQRRRQEIASIVRGIQWPPGTGLHAVEEIPPHITKRSSRQQAVEQAVETAA